MTIYFDTAKDEDDIRQALELYIVDKISLLGITREQYPQHEIERDFRHWLGIYRKTPKGFIIARDDERIIGVAAVALRPPQWMLTNFFVNPRYQGQGIGRELLTRALAVRQGAKQFCIHASTYPNAQMLYLKAGLYPRPNSIWFTLERERLQTLDIPRPLGTAAHKVILEEVIEQINSWDEQLLGFKRAVDHQWWATGGDYYLVTGNGTAEGYFRVEHNGHIGPLVVEDTNLMADALDLALIAAQATSATETNEIMVPGDNQIAIERLLRYGYRYFDVDLLLSSNPMPNLSHMIFFDSDLL